MGKKTRDIPLQPFHLSVTTEMDYLKPDHKNAKVRVVAAAWMIATTACPKGREAVRQSLAQMMDRFKVRRSKDFSSADRAVFNHAFKALNRQDAEESARRAGHANSAVVADADAGDQVRAALVAGGFKGGGEPQDDFGTRPNHH